MNVPVIYSFALSQMFGIFMIILAIVMVSREQFYRKMIASIKADNPIVFFASICSLLLGVFLVDSHNIWELKYRVVITVFCWAVFIKALFWLIMPEKMLSITKSIVAGRGYYWSVLLLAIFGFWFLGRGISLFIIKHITWASH